MKDYYYFLGITHDASQEDIKKAYRKLSLKYHPDKNGNDEFFASRFREILEAYEVLTDESRKKVYDQNYANLKSKKSVLPPKIINFSSNKIRAKKGDEIVLYWQTYDADMVKIVPFGLEKPFGEKRFIISEFDQDGKFQILLHASNTLLQKTIVKGLVITELSDLDFSTHDKVTSNQQSDEITETKFVKWWHLFIAFFLLALMIVWILIS